jgi:hypothetical protein
MQKDMSMRMLKRNLCRLRSMEQLVELLLKMSSGKRSRRSWKLLHPARERNQILKLKKSDFILQIFQISL